MAVATYAVRLTQSHTDNFRRVIPTARVVVSVSTSRSRDDLEKYQRLVSVSSQEKLSTSRSRLGFGRQTSRSHLRFVPKINFRPNCAGHSTPCERALDVVSLCCSYYCSSLTCYKQWTWKITSRPVIAINKTCSLSSRSCLESYKRLVLVSSRNFNVSSRSRAFTSRAHPCQQLTQLSYKL